MPAVVQIVDRVGAAGAVLLDLNRHIGGVMLGPRSEVQLAEVEIAQRVGDQPVLWSTGVDGAAPGELRSRQITVPVVLVSATADDTAALVRQLTELTRSRFLLKVQRHGGTVPVWLRCAPCAPRLNTQVSGAGQPTRIVTGTLVTQTEPYAVGERVDVGPVTITQDPSSGTPFVWDITGVGGDSLTPLVLRSSDAQLRDVLDRVHISVRRRGTPSALAGLVAQAEAGSTSLGASPPTVGAVSDTALSGGSGMRGTYTTGGSGSWTLTVTFPSLTGGQAPGMYRLLTRVRRGGAASGQLFSLVAQAGPQRMVETVTAAGNDVRVVDLGLVQVPTGQPPYLAAPETPTSVSAPPVTVTVHRASPGEGTFDVDWVALIPADEDAGVLEVAAAPGTGVLTVDGWDHQPRVYSTDPFTGVAPAAVGATGVTWIGGVPRLRPGTNRLYVVAGLGQFAATARAKTATLTISGSYWPRHGWLA